MNACAAAIFLVGQNLLSKGACAQAYPKTADSFGID